MEEVTEAPLLSGVPPAKDPQAHQGPQVPEEEVCYGSFIIRVRFLFCLPSVVS